MVINFRVNFSLRSASCDPDFADGSAVLRGSTVTTSSLLEHPAIIANISKSTNRMIDPS